MLAITIDIDQVQLPVAVEIGTGKTNGIVWSIDQNGILERRSVTSHSQPNDQCKTKREYARGGNSHVLPAQGDK
jgi:hypothetical protein